MRRSAQRGHAAARAAVLRPHVAHALRGAIVIEVVQCWDAHGALGGLQLVPIAPQRGQEVRRQRLKAGD
eukprot:5277725-Lingulodinium_polyedra.AAC.1